MSIEIKIPVHPAVPKFLSYRFKITPFFVSRKNPFGCILYNSLVRHQNQFIRDNVDIDLNVYCESLTLLISDRTYRLQGWCLQPQKVLDFNKITLDLLDYEFFMFMDEKTRQGEKIYYSILAFREKYDLLEEDLAVKTLEKKYERYRKELND